MAGDPNAGFQQYYSDDSFWAKLRDFAVAAGAVLVEKALTLYYCARDSATPAWAKGVIFGALGYFILPIDAIPDMLPMAGYTDDLGVLMAAIGAISAHVRPEHAEQARATLQRWFGGGTQPPPVVIDPKQLTLTRESPGTFTGTDNAEPP